MSSVQSGTAEGQLRHARSELASGLRAGTDRRAETLLAAYPALAADADAAIELVYTEFVVRQELGQSPTPAEWYDRFPQWRTDLEQMFQVHDALCQSTAKSAGRSRGEVVLSPTADRSSVHIPGYDILEELGRGGMGVVYRARHTKLNRIVAVKVIRSGEAAGAKERERFRREAEAAARLDHPNIVRVYEVGEHDGRPYCAMEYVGGGQLAARMTGTPWPVGPAARLVAELARAADHAHQRGVVHRDLKPGNILLQNSELGTRNSERKTGGGDSAVRSAFRVPSSEFLPKIADFGLAKCLSDDANPTLTRVGDVVGTPLYMAPEQAAGRDTVGPPADVWALGVILYELLTGHPPFTGDSAAETLHQVKTAEPVPPRHLRAKLPQDLDTICLRCLQKEPHRRYSSAAAVADDLERWARGEAIAARPVRWPEVAAKWARREPVVAALAAGIVAVTLFGLVGVLWQWQRADRERDDAVHAGKLADIARVDADRVGELEASARASAEAQLYASRVAQVALDVAASRTAAAEQLLDDCKAREPDRCRWEWDYLKRKCRAPVVEMAGHTQPVNTVAYSPDGALIVSGGGVWNARDPGEVKVWSAATGVLLHNLRGPNATVHKVAFHPSGTWLAAASTDGRVWRWDVRRPADPLPPFVCGTGAYSFAFHPDGRTLAVAGSDGTVQVWDTVRGERLVHGAWHEHNVYDVAYSPDGRLLASVCRDGAMVVRSTADYLVRFERRLFSDGRRVAFSPDGRLLAAYSYSGELTVWDVAEGGKRVADHHVGAGNARGLAFRPDGRHLACAARDTDVRVWFVRGQYADPTQGKGTGPANAVAYSPDARRLAVAREDNVIRVWDTTAPPEPRVDSWTDAWLSGLAVSADGTIALAATKNQAFMDNTTKLVRLYPVGGGPAVNLTGHTGWPTCVAVRPDGRKVAAADDTGVTLIWDMKTFAKTGLLTGHTGAVWAVAYSADNTRLATAGADGTVRLWDADTGAERGRIDHPAGVHAVAFSDDGRHIATGCGDRLVRVWDAATLDLRHALAGHRAAVNAVAFRPRSAELASADEDQELRFWSADTGKTLAAHAPSPTTYPTAETEDTTAVRPAVRIGTSLAFSPDGRRLAFGSTTRPVRLWDADARRPLLDLGEPNFVHRQSVAFSPDGGQLIAASRNQVTFWDARVVDPARRRAESDRRATAWHAERAAADLLTDDGFGADFHYTRALAADPHQPSWHAARGEARALLGRAADADADHARALALTTPRLGLPALIPGDAAVWHKRAEALARLGRWSGVIEANRFAQWHDPTAVLHGYNLAMAHMAAGDTAAYRSACRALARRTEGDPAMTRGTVFAAAAGDAFTADEWLRIGKRAGSDRSKAITSLRAGRYADAVRAFTQAHTHTYPRGWDMLLRAMAHHHNGQADEATAWLARARVWVAAVDRVADTPTAWAGTRWQDWNERALVQALQREAERMIAPASRE